MYMRRNVCFVSKIKIIEKSAKKTKAKATIKANMSSYSSKFPTRLVVVAVPKCLCSDLAFSAA